MVRSAVWSIERATATVAWLLVAAVALVLASTSSVALAQQQAAEEGEEEEQPKLEIHGFLTQAYAQTDGAQILGITEDGTSDYRTAALQMRYAFSEGSSFVAQLSHESLGESPLQGLRDEVELDWLFYEQRWERSALRVGKVPIPLGIWNEVRDAGTVLPFYRPPNGFYGESAFASETVDGLLLSHSFELGGGFGLEGDLYYGDRRSFQLSVPATTEVRIHDSLGTQLWLSTPVRGLRLGLCGQRFEVSGEGLAARRRAGEWEQLCASVEGQFEWFVVRGEVQWLDGPSSDFQTSYVQLGFHLSSRLDLNLQAAESKREEVLGPLRLDFTADEDLAAGIAYRFAAYLVLKAELHRNEGFLSEDPAISIPGAPLETWYGILSLATGF